MTQMADYKMDNLNRHLGFHNNQASNSPKFTCFKDNYNYNKEPVNIGFSNKEVKDDLNITDFLFKKNNSDDDSSKFEFGNHEKEFYSDEKDEEYNFFFNEDSKPESFRQPMKKPRKESIKPVINHTGEKLS